VALARRLVQPIRVLQASALEIGAGRLEQRIEVGTGDELDALGDQFNRMAERLQQTHATLESRIAERTRELSDANDAKTRFLAVASHDLRQPMHALTLFVEQLRHDCAGNASLAGLAQRIDASVDALRELLDALLDLSKLDSGGVVAEPHAFALQPIFERLGESFGPAARAKGIALAVHPTSLWVASDARLLERILLNFVGNAVRYTETGRIVIGCRRRGALAEIMVVDTGIGIAEEELPHVFREFHQVGEAGGHRSQGLGLGLAIVDRLARLLGHEVRARSQPQRGSSFGVLVPVTSPRLEVAGAGAVAAPEAVSLAGLRVLVVDDDPAARAALAGLLDRWECLVDEADVGVAALDAARRQVPGAVVCDLRLHGGESGFDVLDALRAQCAPSPVAFLITGDYSQEHVAEASRRGYQILAKPVPPARLRALLEQLLRERAGS
jgi:signal transduction histidine kinase/CheY-like chemotaxis protein